MRRVEFIARSRDELTDIVHGLVVDLVRVGRYHPLRGRAVVGLLEGSG